MTQAKSEEKVIGIPRAMSFYNNYPFYYGFFNDLGIKIILSDVTTKQTMSEGAGLVVTETCLPIKVYIGHILNLLNKGVDKIFVPSLQSIDHKIYNCSKIRGLPEIIRNIINQPFKMIEPTLDKTNNIGFKDFCYDTAHQLEIYDNDKIENAIELGNLLQGMNCYVNLIPYNETNHLQYKRSSKEDILKFYDVLKKNNINVTIRREFGSKINAACGQLKTVKENLA